MSLQDYSKKIVTDAAQDQVGLGLPMWITLIVTWIDRPVWPKVDEWPGHIEAI